VLPLFLPFAGCPGRCIFCDQHAQTGVAEAGWEACLQRLEEMLAARQGAYGLGLFGGTFTGLPVPWQERFLRAAGHHREHGGLAHLRVSTRPDRVDAETLARLRAGGVSMVELGVQTFDRRVLGASGRGYDGALAENACRLVREAGLELGIQLLPGLPGHGAEEWRQDVLKALGLRPDVVRIYPCVVMSGTGLAEMHARGEYEPWPLDMAAAECGRAVLAFWQAGVRVIRIGLASEESMLARLVAGPWHPAFGNMVRSRALYLLLEEQLCGQAGRVRLIRLPRHLNGELWGHARANAPALKNLGITRENAAFGPEPDIVVELEE